MICPYEQLARRYRPSRSTGQIHLVGGVVSVLAVRQIGTVAVMNAEEPLDAGGFAGWIASMQAALRGDVDSDVPCGSCAACCTASHFIHIEPDESDTLAHIPAALLFPAPGLPRGHVLLGHDERGHCPMLVDGACTIYAHRPRTCRMYDCRFLAAAGVGLEDDPSKAAIAVQIRRWRFRYDTDEDRARAEAVRAAVEAIRSEVEEETRAGSGPTDTAIAIHSIEVHEHFMPPPPPG